MPQKCEVKSMMNRVSKVYGLRACSHLAWISEFALGTNSGLGLWQSSVTYLLSNKRTPEMSIKMVGARFHLLFFFFPLVPTLWIYISVKHSISITTLSSQSQNLKQEVICQIESITFIGKQRWKWKASMLYLVISVMVWLKHAPDYCFQKDNGLVLSRDRLI